MPSNEHGRPDPFDADRLLSGQRIGLPRLETLLGHATASARPGDLAGEAGAVAAFRAARASAAAAEASAPRHALDTGIRESPIVPAVVPGHGYGRMSLGVRALRVLTLAVAATAVTVILAAHTGLLPGLTPVDGSSPQSPGRPGNPVATSGNEIRPGQPGIEGQPPPGAAPEVEVTPARSSPPPPGSSLGGATAGAVTIPSGASTGGANSGGTDPGSGERTGPVTEPSRSHRIQGLCRAYLAHLSAGSGKPFDAPMLVELVAAAGSPDQVATYCHDLLHSSAPGHG